MQDLVLLPDWRFTGLFEVSCLQTLIAAAAMIDPRQGNRSVRPSVGWQSFYFNLAEMVVELWES